MEKIQLKVYGLSYSQKQTSVYALILGQLDGPVRIPVVIGPAEAQAIAMHLENIKPPRPMTHDLFSALHNAFGIELKEVFIYKFLEGVFYCEMTFADDSREVVLDARTSDAVAVALRCGAPIFTTREVLEETGFVIEGEENANAESADTPAESGTLKAREAKPARRRPPLESYSIEELERTLQNLIETEQYEEASKVSEILKRKRESNDPKAEE